MRTSLSYQNHDKDSEVTLNRSEIVRKIGQHLALGAESWATLPVLLKSLMKDKSPADLFSSEKLNPSKNTYTKEMESDITRDDFHASFFSFAPGAVTPAHNHKVNCVSYIIAGPVAETLYEQTEENIKERVTHIRGKDSVVSDLVINGKSDFIHSVSNPTDKPKYSMHVYNCKKGDSPNGDIFKASQIMPRSML